MLYCTALRFRAKGASDRSRSIAIQTARDIRMYTCKSPLPSVSRVRRCIERQQATRCSPSLALNVAHVTSQQRSAGKRLSYKFNKSVILLFIYTSVYHINIHNLQHAGMWLHLQRSGSTRRLANRSATSTRLDEYLPEDLWPPLEHKKVSHSLDRR